MKNELYSFETVIRPGFDQSLAGRVAPRAPYALNCPCGSTSPTNTITPAIKPPLRQHTWGRGTGRAWYQDMGNTLISAHRLHFGFSESGEATLIDDGTHRSRIV